MVKAYFQIKKIPLFLTATPLLFTRQWCSCWLVLSGCREPQVVKDISSMTGSAAGVAVASWCYSLKGQTWCYTSMTWHLHCRFTNRGILLSQADCPTMFDIPFCACFQGWESLRGNECTIVGGSLHRSRLVNSRLCSAPKQRTVKAHSQAAENRRLEQMQKTLNKQGVGHTYLKTNKQKSCAGAGPNISIPLSQSRTSNI